MFDQYRFDPEMPMLPPILRDLNNDGLPEIVFGYSNYVSVVGGLAVSILGWRGTGFQDIITPAATEPQWDTPLD